MKIRSKIRDSFARLVIRLKILLNRMLYRIAVKFWPNYTEWHGLLRIHERELLVALSLCSDEGRARLGMAMIEPIRRSLDYQEIGRRLLMVDELPQGAYARYENETLRMAQERLANTQNNPNWTFDTFTGFRNEDIAGIGHIWSPDIYISDPHNFIAHGRQEDALYEYLIWRKELKMQEQMVERKEQVKNPILELGG